MLNVALNIVVLHFLVRYEQISPICVFWVNIGVSKDLLEIVRSQPLNLVNGVKYLNINRYRLFRRVNLVKSALAALNFLLKLFCLRHRLCLSVMNFIWPQQSDVSI